MQVKEYRGIKEKFFEYIGEKDTIESSKYRASYKLILLLKLLESCNGEGSAAYDTVCEKIAHFYLAINKKYSKAEVDNFEIQKQINYLTINSVKLIMNENAYRVINKDGYIFKKDDQNEMLCFSEELWKELNKKDRKVLISMLDNKLKVYYEKRLNVQFNEEIVSLNAEMKKEYNKVLSFKNERLVLNKKSSSKVLTPIEKLKKRILKEFPHKKLIGDIIINNEEHKLLIEYFKTKYENLKNSYTHVINDPIFATALVQIGIKYYDSNFWGHVAEVVGIEKVNTVYQSWIGESFVHTLLSNNKIMIDKSEKVNNILMHGFVSDFYANEMFDFLFKYYNIDLERDLKRNDADMMRNFIEIIKRNDNTGRTYLLVKQTANAICANERGGKIRIRRILRLIDKCFWEQITPVNPVSRLSILFNSWQENSNEFRTQYQKYNSGVIFSKGKKSYSSPYLKCNLAEMKFKIILPTQLIKFEFAHDIKWNIYSQGQSTLVDGRTYQAVTGYKTEQSAINIKPEDIFNEFIIELTHKGTCIRQFKIKADCIRFFDRDGDYLNSDSNLLSGEVYAITKENETPRSEALIENEVIGKLVRSYFEFEYGDIVRIPDGKTISIGKKLEEGLLPRKVLKGVSSKINDLDIPVYTAAPTILLKIAEKRANGTSIIINNSRYRLFDKETTVFNLGDRSGEIGYILSLGDYGCTQDGIYTVSVDVPNDRTNRFWVFALVNGMSYVFEDAPYIFKSKGTIRFNDKLVISTKYQEVTKNTDENSFNFYIDSELDSLEFKYKIEETMLDLSFRIPVLKWKFDNGQWNVEKTSDIWHSDFPTMIYFKYLAEKIRLSMDEQIGNENALEEQAITYVKSKTKGLFECDVTRFKSWFGREKVVRKLFIDLPGNRTEFANVITQSVVVSHMLKGDFESEKLIGEFEIIGNANYFVDVILIDTDKKLVEKLPLLNGKFSFESSLTSGLYKINIFEDEEDDTGFGVSNYLLIGEFKHNIINPYNLEGKCIEVKYIKKGEASFSQLQLNSRHIINNLKLVNIVDKHIYSGRLLIKTHNNNYLAYDVNVDFYELDKLQYLYLTYFDGYDYLEFMYDTNQKTIVKKEEEGLKRAVKYRRYECLYPSEYSYVVAFTQYPITINESLIVDETKLDTTYSQPKIKTLGKEKYNDDTKMTIEEMGFKIRTYNCLNRAKIRTAKDILERGIEGLYKVRNLGKSNIEEVISIMKELGFTLENKSTPSYNSKEEILINKTQIAASKEDLNEKKQEDKIDESEATDIFTTSLSEIGLSAVVYNCLKKSGVLTVGDAVEKGSKKLSYTNGLNKQMYKEVIDRLRFLGISIV